MKQYYFLLATLFLPSYYALLAPICLACDRGRLLPIHAVNDNNRYQQPQGSERSSRVDELVATGISTVYLAQFASLYTQLPGLFGSSGLLPISERLANDPLLSGSLWALPTLQAEIGMELFAGAGMVLAAAQLIFRHLRTGWAGFITYGLEWIFWHDLVIAGGRFMQYQMDTILLDVAPISLLAPFSPQAAMIGYRWLLARLYLGAGSVKLLSCDDSWRNLSAVHWHFQSQPLPNPIGTWAYDHVPLSISQALTWFILVGEMTAPYLIMAQSRRIRQLAFGLNVIVMAGIATFGNFGTLQAVLTIVGFALLYDEDTSDEGGSVEVNTRDLLSVGVDAIVLGLTAAGGFWAVQGMGAQCIDTLPIEPLAYGLIVLGAVTTILPLYSGSELGTVCVAMFLVASSVTTLGVDVPFSGFWDSLNVGAQRYGLFATMTGIDGRPVPVIEGATNTDGPWYPIPLLYQVNDPSRPLPVCFPHFPRVDWTLWFIPFGEGGLWISKFFQGITVSDPTILHLLDEASFHRTFPTEPPAIVRVVPRTYEWINEEWKVSPDRRFDASFVLAEYKRKDISETSPQSWPSTPFLGQLSASVRPEYFIWGCLGATGMARHIVEISMAGDWSSDED